MTGERAVFMYIIMERERVHQWERKRKSERPRLSSNACLQHGEQGEEDWTMCRRKLETSNPRQVITMCALIGPEKHEIGQGQGKVSCAVLSQCCLVAPSTGGQIM